MQNNNFILDTDDPVDIRKDGIFKAVFTKDCPESMGALSGLVSALIGREVTIVTILANEPSVNNTRDRQIRFDINCKAKNGELINVEMSVNPRLFEPVRLEFHAAKLFSGQDIKGIDKNYDDLKHAYQITILAKERLFSDETFFHTFEYFDPVNQISLNGRTQIITLELSKLKTIAEKPATEMSHKERWAVYFGYLTDRSKRCTINEIVAQEESIAMASSVLIKVSRDEEERARIMRDEKTELDYISYMSHMREELFQHFLEKISANDTVKFPQEQLREKIHTVIYEELPEDICFKIVKQNYYGTPLEQILGNGLGAFLENQIIGHAQGRAEGLEQGIAQGLEQGIKQGHTQGLAQGETKRNNEIARNALAEGASIEFVQKITGLPMESIEQLL